MTTGITVPASKLFLRCMIVAPAVGILLPIVAAARSRANAPSLKLVVTSGAGQTRRRRARRVCARSAKTG